MRAARTAGFTLIEQLLAVALLGVGLLGSCRLFAEALRSLRDSRQHDAAIVRGEDLLESIVAVDAGAALQAGTCQIGEPLCTSAPAYELSTWLAALRQVSPDATARLLVADQSPGRAITLQIRWTDSRGTTALRQLERLVGP